MLLKDASRTKYESISLAVTVLEMPTMSIVKSLEPLWAINWNDARPWIVMLGAVILFLGWDLRKKRREIQKLDLEIAQLRSQQSLVRVATIHEMNSLIKDVEEISARKLGILGSAKKSARTFALEGKLLGCFCEVRFPVFSSWPSMWIVLSSVLSCSEIYGRFMGGSDRNRSNSGRRGQCVQHMQIAQSRINTGYFASC
jgi:hypothetical protein